MIQISKGEIFYCGYFITDLKTPFIKLKNIPQYTKTPSETILNKRISYYTFAYKNHYYRLVRSTKSGFRFHSIYKTDTTVKKSIREIVLNECLDNKEIRWKIVNYLQKITDILVKSFSFTLIVTDFKINFDTGIRHVLGDWNIINADRLSVFKKSRIYLEENDNKISISNCGKELNIIDPLRYSDIDLSEIKKHKRILILSKTNGFYSSYLANYFYKQGVKEVLPVTLFLV